MKPTFRKFLEDIDVSASAYTRSEADSVISQTQDSINKKFSSKTAVASRWKELPVEFEIDGFSVLYRKNTAGNYDIALVDVRDLSGYKMPFGLSLPKESHRVVTNVNASNYTLGILDNQGSPVKLRGLTTEVLSGAALYRGSGLAPLLYKTLVQNGQVLFSSDTQTPGGQATWRRLVKSVESFADVCVVVPLYYADAVINRNIALNRDLLARLDLDLPNKRVSYDSLGKTGAEEFLVMGNLQSLDKLVYSESTFRWAILPHGTLDGFENHVIRIK